MVSLFNFVLENGWHSGNYKRATIFSRLPSWVSYFSPNAFLVTQEITSFSAHYKPCRVLSIWVMTDKRFDSDLPCLTVREVRTVAWMDPPQVTQMFWASLWQEPRKSSLLWWHLKKNWITSTVVPGPMKITRRLENGFVVLHGNKDLQVMRANMCNVLVFVFSVWCLHPGLGALCGSEQIGIWRGTFETGWGPCPTGQSIPTLQR